MIHNYSYAATCHISGWANAAFLDQLAYLCFTISVITSKE